MDLVKPGATDIPIRQEERNDWKVAAETWRLPYWDFALRRSYNKNRACVPQQALIDGDPLLPFTMGVGLPKLPGDRGNPLYAYKYPLAKGEKPSKYGIERITFQPREDSDVMITLPVSSDFITISQWEQHCEDLD